jgi:hypothetical protein
VKPKVYKHVDFKESFMRSHTIVRARTYKRVVPDWARNNKATQKIILQAFPNMATDPEQRAQAARWAAVIHLYFRVGYTRGQIVEELGSSYSKIHGVIRSILRVSKGLRADGSGSRMP